LNNKELALAPWNAIRFPYGNAVFWHFQGLRILLKGRVDLGSIYEIPIVTIHEIYYKYFEDLAKIEKIFYLSNIAFKAQKKEFGFLNSIKKIIRFSLDKLLKFKIFFPESFK
jgi:hypothetical protein